MGRIRALILAFFGGAVFLSYEILWIRMFSFAAKSRPYVFGLILGVYLAGIAFGSLGSRFLFLRREKPVLFSLPLLYAASAILCYSVVPLTIFIASKITYGYWWGLIPLCAAAIAAGGIFPLLVKTSETSEQDTGSRVAHLSAANIAGSLAGSLGTGFFLLNILPLSVISAGAAVAGLGCTIICLPRNKSIRKQLIIYTIILISVFGVLNARGPIHNEMYKKLMYMRRHIVIQPFERVIENRSGVICLNEDGVVFGDGAYDGRLNTDFYPKINSEIELAYLTFLFHPEPKDILVVGLATGAWTQVIANGPGVKKITAVEINPGYLELIKDSPEVSSLLTNPKVDIVIDDGRHWLVRNPEKRFDYIVLNTTFHWRSGATNLLSSEFMSMVKKHLTSGGTVLINTTGSREVVATVNAAFSHTAAYRIYIAASDLPFSLNKENFKRIMSEFKVEGKPVIDLTQKDEAEALEYYLKIDYLKEANRRREWAMDAEIITDDNMVTEFQ